MKRPSLTKAVDWIAANDESAEMDPEVVQYQLTVLMAADLFGADPAGVARAVVALRREEVEPDGTALVVYADGSSEELGRFEPMDT